VVAVFLEGALEDRKPDRKADLVLAGLIVYTVILGFATLDEILGWGLLAPYF